MVDIFAVVNTTGTCIKVAKLWTNPLSKLINSQMISFGVIISSTHHKKQLHSWPTSPTSLVVIYSQLPSYLGEMEPFKDYLGTRRHLTSHKDKPQQK